MAHQTREPFKRLSQDYITTQRKKGVESINILNSYNQKEITEWLRRGMEGWYVNKLGLSGFIPVELEFMCHGDWSIMEGLFRIYVDKQLTVRTRRRVSGAVFNTLIKTPADEKNLLLFGEICNTAVNMVSATKMLRAVPSLLRGDTPEAYVERLHTLCTWVANSLASKAPKTGIRVLHRIVRDKAFNSNHLGMTLVRLVEVDPKNLKTHLSSLSHAARVMKPELIKRMSPWLSRDLIKLTGVQVLQKNLIAPEWRWLRKAVTKASKSARKKRAT